MAPLSSIRILDLSRYIAGPTCTQALADLGATIYKIERPGNGDEIRAIGPFPNADDAQGRKDTGAYLAWNRGKQSITVDIAKPAGAQIIRDLAAKCDALVENYKVGALARYGLDYATLSKSHPGLVWCSVTGFGQTGPEAPKAAFDGIMQGRAGLASVAGPAEGTPGSTPMRTPINMIDVSTGLFGAVAILGALWQCRETGQGQFIDVSLLDTAVFLNSQFALGYLLNGKVTQRAGNRNPGGAPSDAFKTRDGHIIMICTNETLWAALCKEIGKPEWINDPRFRSVADRVRNSTELYSALDEIFLQHSTAEWEEKLDRAGIPASPMNDIAQTFELEQVKHRGIQMELTRPNGQTVPAIRSPLRLSNAPVDHRAPPLLGEHTDRVLREVLGKSAEEIAQLKADRVI